MTFLSNDVYIQDEQVLVAVQEGIVEVQAAGNHQLLAGQQIAFNHNGEFQQPNNLTVAGLTAWRQGKLVFQNKSLKEVLAELGRYHNTRISLQNQQLNTLRVSGTFNIDNLNNALNAISLLLPVHIRHAANQEIILESGKSSVH